MRVVVHLMRVGFVVFFTGAIIEQQASDLM